MVKLAHRKKTRAPIQIGVGSNIVAPTRTSQGNSILKAIWFNGQAYFAGHWKTTILGKKNWSKLTQYQIIRQKIREPSRKLLG